MKIIGNLYKRCIYAAEFDNNFVYIGLTYSFNKRINEHLTDKKSKVFKHIKETNIFPEFKKLTDYIDNLKAKEYEEYYLNNYKNNNWNILNVAKTGALGGFLD
jgi:predicted GIY-YIG superfamily endonuclease